MVKALSLLLAILTAGGAQSVPVKGAEEQLIPPVKAEQTLKPMQKPPLAGGGYYLEGEPMPLPETEENTPVNPTEDYDEQAANDFLAEEKEELKEKYAYMFTLKEEIDELRKKLNELKRDYRAYKKEYERDCSRLYSEWSKIYDALE